MQMTLPQLRQFGAAARRGCFAPTQLHLREAIPAAVFVECVGFVVISRARMAWSRSVKAVEAPCMGTPPVMVILVVFALFLEEGPGVEVLEFGFDRGFDLGRPSSEIKVPPAAEGGSFGAF